MEHSKGKWNQNGTIIQDATGYTIAQVWPDTRKSSKDSISMMQANGERICKCVNGWDDLVKALKKAQEHFEDIHFHHTTPRQKRANTSKCCVIAIDEIKEAIAEAK